MSSTASVRKAIDPEETVTHVEAWRRSWLETAAHIRRMQMQQQEGLAALIERLVNENAEAEERDRAERERQLLEETGTVGEVAARTGFTARYLYHLLEEGKLTNYAAEGEDMRVRYSAVWELRKVPLQLIDQVRAPRRSRAKDHERGAPHRVTVRVIK